MKPLELGKRRTKMRLIDLNVPEDDDDDEELMRE